MKDNKNNDDKIQINLPLNKKLLKYTFAIIVMIALVYVVVATPQKIGSFISSAISLLSPFIIGLCFAYVVNLLMMPLEKFWFFIWRKVKKQNIIKKLKRPVSLVFSYIIVLGVIFAIVFMIIPALSNTVVSFSEKVPQYLASAEKWYDKVIDFFAHYNFELPELKLDTAQVTDFAKNLISNYGGNVLGTTVNITASIVSAVVELVLGIVFSIYVLSKKEVLCRQAKKIVYALLKPRRAKRLVDFTALTNGVFTRFVTGQLTEACIIGVLCFIGMLIFRMPYAAMISVLIGFTALIPMFGSFIGTAIGAFLILLESPIKAVWFVVFIIVLQQLEGNLIYPKVVGKSIGLPGIWVLTAVTIGGRLFGVMGMLFGVPVASIIYVIFKEFINSKSKKSNAVTDSETQTESTPE